MVCNLVVICYLSTLVVLLSVGSQTNTAARSNPTGAAGIGGLGGLGLPGLDRTMGISDPSTMNQLLQNPGVSQMMQSMLSNPQYMNQVGVLNTINLEFGCC